MVTLRPRGCVVAYTRTTAGPTAGPVPPRRTRCERSPRCHAAGTCHTGEAGLGAVAYARPASARARQAACTARSAVGDLLKDRAPRGSAAARRRWSLTADARPPIVDLPRLRPVLRWSAECQQHGLCGGRRSTGLTAAASSWWPRHPGRANAHRRGATDAERWLRPRVVEHLRGLDVRSPQSGRCGAGHAEADEGGGVLGAGPLTSFLAAASNDRLEGEAGGGPAVVRSAQRRVALDGDAHAGRVGTAGQGLLPRRAGQGAFQRVSSVT
ncbi:hypothetical protein EES46_23065 [Streptomyces sp. ADI98-10]|nr:hypothetical protein EES46_23065 [Streptomyces sp. ADI98-10]